MEPLEQVSPVVNSSCCHRLTALIVSEWQHQRSPSGHLLDGRCSLRGCCDDQPELFVTPAFSPARNFPCPCGTCLIGVHDIAREKRFFSFFLSGFRNHFVTKLTEGKNFPDDFVFSCFFIVIVLILSISHFMKHHG